MNQLATFTFNDSVSVEEVCVIVRFDRESVVLAVSMSKAGDVEFAMGKQSLIEAKTRSGYFSLAT
ncbi:hypothetical protein KIH39_04575 [Telmatocola sphagniphila]|uniref:Uncharacterized protein n=1 Tax=Telmatocola sphagniphila TaxID=1123043 RepID=A0A8E6B9T4_9BACT|nr:hypothetical protein [Telmatocola sphagniphila]QVL33198.1 hypothetical protein KIH39_04575 [Telmatocola sphagniphila]